MLWQVVRLLELLVGKWVARVRFGVKQVDAEDVALDYLGEV
jgi:hypothetical protein